jgi:hypothetical protein
MFDRRGLRLPLLLAALAVGLGACSTSPSPNPSPSPSPATVPSATTPAASVVATPPASPTPVPEPSPVGTPSSIAAPCEPADVKASHGLVEGAAGSRLTSVVLVAAITCSVEASPAFVIRDAAGAPVVAGIAGGPGRIDLDPDNAYETEVRTANWCTGPWRFPFRLELVVNDRPIVVTGLPFPEEADVPPCNGSGGPILEATSWTASP